MEKRPHDTVQYFILTNINREKVCTGRLANRAATSSYVRSNPVIPFGQTTSLGTIASRVISIECHISKHHRPTTGTTVKRGLPLVRRTHTPLLAVRQPHPSLEPEQHCHHQPFLLLLQNLTPPAASNKHDVHQWISVKGSKMGGTCTWHKRWWIDRKFQINKPLAKV